MRYNHARAGLIARLSVAALLSCAGAAVQAVTITNISLINNSSPDESRTFTSGRLHEFRTRSDLGAVQTAAGSLSFTSRFQWYNGHLATGGFAQTHKRNVVYDLLFDISDPGNDGYTLRIDTGLAGYATAIWGSGANALAVIATSTNLSGRIDTDTTDGTNTLGAQVGGLTLLGSGSGATANATTPFARGFTSVTGSYLAGDFIGTRSFALRFSSATTPTTNVFMQNHQTGQGSVGFGLTNTLAGLDPSGQPQPGDLDADQLGHFVTVNVESQAIGASVPEPATLWLLLAGLAGLRARVRPAACPAA